MQNNSGLRTAGIVTAAPARAQVKHIDNLSAYANSNEILRWLLTLAVPPKLTFITHGEPDAFEALRCRIKRELK